MNESPTKEMRFDACSVKLMDPNNPRRPTFIPSKNGSDEAFETILTSFPELKRIKAFTDYPGTPGGEMNKDMVLKYIIILYSEDSFLNIKPLPPLEKRMYDAAELAGFERKDDGSFEDHVEQKLFMLYSDYIVEMALGFLQFQMHDVWSEMIIISHELIEYRKIRLAPVTDEKDAAVITATEKKDRLRLSCDKMVKTLKEYEDLFFKDHDNLKDKVKKKRVTLESRAKGK